MIYICRFIWLIGYVPLFILECIMIFILLLTYPFVGVFYFIKTGSCENIPYYFITPVMDLDDRYKKLLLKIEDHDTTS